MLDKDLSYFFPENKQEKDQYIIDGPSTFVYPKGHEKEGLPIEWIIEPVEVAERDAILEECKYNEVVEDEKGKKKVVKKVDLEKYSPKFIVASVVYPNFKDPQLLEKYNTINPCDVYESLVTLVKDQERIVSEINAINGIGEENQVQFEKIKQQAKN